MRLGSFWFLSVLMMAWLACLAQYAQQKAVLEANDNPRPITAFLENDLEGSDLTDESGEDGLFFLEAFYPQHLPAIVPFLREQHSLQEQQQHCCSQGFMRRLERPPRV